MSKLPVSFLICLTVSLCSFASIICSAQSGDSRAGAAGVMTVVTEDEAVSFHTRLTAARNLSSQLNRGSLNMLFSFLDRYNSEDPMPPGKLNALKNDVANAISAQANSAQVFSEHLIAMHNDPEHDPVWRDYCIQFLADCYRQEERQSVRKKIEETLWKAASRDWSIAGTALITLTRLGESIDQSKVAEKAFQTASDNEAGTAARITALQICANADYQKVLPLARTIVQSDAEVTLRISALGAIGILGNSSDLATLKKYTKSSDSRLQYAGRAAIERIRKKTE